MLKDLCLLYKEIVTAALVEGWLKLLMSVPET